MRRKNIRPKSLNTKRTSTPIAVKIFKLVRIDYISSVFLPLLFFFYSTCAQIERFLAMIAREKIIKTHPFEWYGKKIRKRKGQMVVYRQAASSRLVLSRHGNGWELFFSFPPLRASSFFLSTFGLDSFGQGTHFFSFVETFLERHPLCGPDTTAIRATLNNTILLPLLNRHYSIEAECSFTSVPYWFRHRKRKSRLTFKNQCS